MNSTIVAAAGGAIAMALLDKLVEKGILTRPEAGNILGNAITELTAARGSEVLAATQHISTIAQKFSQS
jgi:hypothetical protein